MREPLKDTGREENTAFSSHSWLPWGPGACFAQPLAPMTLSPYHSPPRGTKRKNRNKGLLSPMNVNEWLLNENDKRNERVCECFWEKETNQERSGKRSRGPCSSPWSQKARDWWLHKLSPWIKSSSVTPSRHTLRGHPEKARPPRQQTWVNWRHKAPGGRSFRAGARVRTPQETPLPEAASCAPQPLCPGLRPLLYVSLAAGQHCWRLVACVTLGYTHLGYRPMRGEARVRALDLHIFILQLSRGQFHF